MTEGEHSLLALALGAILVSAPPAHAQAVNNTVQYLYTACAESDRDERYADHFQGAWCLGYVRGLVDGHDVYALTQNQNGCGDGSMSAEQIRRIFMRWADANPQYWNAPAATGVAAAIYEAGMCS